MVAGVVNEKWIRKLDCFLRMKLFMIPNDIKSVVVENITLADDSDMMYAFKNEVRRVQGTNL